MCNECNYEMCIILHVKGFGVISLEITCTHIARMTLQVHEEKFEIRKYDKDIVLQI